MRKIILWTTVSLDGFIEGADGGLEWHRVDDELHSYFNQEIAGMGAFLEGRLSHQLMADYWPTADQDPSSSATTAEFAAIWRDMPKLVYSKTLEHADWNATVVRDVVPDEVLALKAQPGGDLVLGGANLAASFLRQDLVDEIRLYVNPVVLGAGKPLFAPSTKRIDLELAETRAFGNGVVMLRYERASGHEGSI